jgi:hypothetical protein
MYSLWIFWHLCFSISCKIFIRKQKMSAKNDRVIKEQRDYACVFLFTEDSHLGVKGAIFYLLINNF